MATVSEIAVDVKAHIRDFKRDLAQARSEMRKTEDQADDLQDSTGKGLLGGGFGGGLVGGFVGGAIGGLVSRVSSPLSNLISALLAPVLVAMLPLLKKLSNLLADDERREGLVQRIRGFLNTTVSVLTSIAGFIATSTAALVAFIQTPKGAGAAKRGFLTDFTQSVLGGENALTTLPSSIGAGAQSGLGLGRDFNQRFNNLNQAFQGQVPTIPNGTTQSGGNHAKQAPGNPDGLVSNIELRRASNNPGTE